MAKDVLYINAFKFGPVMFTVFPPSSFSKTGKSSLGNVDKLYLPELVSIFRLSPSRKK